MVCCHLFVPVEHAPCHDQPSRNLPFFSAAPNVCPVHLKCTVAPIAHVIVHSKCKREHRCTVKPNMVMLDKRPVIWFGARHGHHRLANKGVRNVQVGHGNMRTVTRIAHWFYPNVSKGKLFTIYASLRRRFRSPSNQPCGPETRSQQAPQRPSRPHPSISLLV
jgi:hypothetical protein